MQTYPPVQYVLDELYGAMQTFLHLGFPAEELFVNPNILMDKGAYPGRKCVGIRLRWEGKEFNYGVGPVKNYKKFAKKWLAFGEAANASGGNQELDKLFLESQCFGQVWVLINLLMDKGIQVPIKPEPPPPDPKDLN